MPMIKKIIWVLPFCAFIGGYYGMLRLYGTKSVQVPFIVGMSIEQALATVSHASLHLHLLAEHEDSQLKSGIVLEQIPDGGCWIKEQQALYCVISKKPLCKNMPLLIGHMIQSAQQLLQERKIMCKVYKVQSELPIGMCIAQYPQVEQLIDTSEYAILYESMGIERKLVCPNCIGKSLDTVVEMVSKHAIGYELQYDNDSQPSSDLTKYEIIDQRPSAGSIISIDHNGISTIRMDFRCVLKQ